MVDWEEDEQQAERGHGNHAKNSRAQHSMCTGMNLCMATMLSPGVHGIETITMGIKTNQAIPSLVDQRQP